MPRGRHRGDLPDRAVGALFRCGPQSAVRSFHPEAYAQRAERNGLRVERLERELCRWDFGGREGFADWAGVTFVEWMRKIPKAGHASFIADVLDSYDRIDATGRPGLFQFYQMEVVLRPASAG